MKKIITLSMLFMATVLFAQEEEAPAPSFSVSGSVDAYYRANLTAPNDENAIAPGSSFANLPGFALGMANVIMSYEGEKAGFVADLVFGPRGTDAIFASPMYSATGDIVNQLYAYWNVSESVTLTMGNFNTFLGYEVISPTANFNYSTSYLFSNGPFSHVGLKADFTLSDDFSLMLAVMNPTDINNNTTGDYALGAQLGYKGQYLNFYYDSGVVLGFEIDYTGGFDVSDEIFLGINAAYADNDGSGFYGAAVYPQYSLSEDLSIGLRGEYFGFHFEEGDDETVFATTLSGNYKIDNLTIIPEIRLDSWNEDTYANSDLEPTKSLAVFTLAAVYTF